MSKKKCQNSMLHHQDFEKINHSIIPNHNHYYSCKIIYYHMDYNKEFPKIKVNYIW